MAVRDVIAVFIPIDPTNIFLVAAEVLIHGLAVAPINVIIIILVMMLLPIAIVEAIVLSVVPVDPMVVVGARMMLPSAAVKVIVISVVARLIMVVEAIVIAVVPIYLTIISIDVMIIVLAIVLLVYITFSVGIIGLAPPLVLVQLLAYSDRLVVSHVRRSLVREEASYCLVFGQFPVDEGILRVFGYRPYVGVVVALRYIGAERVGRRAGRGGFFLRRRLRARARA